MGRQSMDETRDKAQGMVARVTDFMPAGFLVGHWEAHVLKRQAPAVKRCLPAHPSRRGLIETIEAKDIRFVFQGLGHLGHRLEVMALKPVLHRLSVHLGLRCQVVARPKKGPHCRRRKS